MPEAAEVKSLGNVLNTATGLVIREARVTSGRYTRAAPDLQRLRDATIERVTVKGKLIVLHLRDSNQDPFAVLSTLGMTGWWYRVNAGNPLPPDAKHVRIEIDLRDGSTLVFVDQRNFGTFRVVSYSMAKAKLAELGPDIMTPKHLWASITLPEFKARVARFGRGSTVAEIMLDQRIAAGCGNYIRADAMYLANASPLRAASELTGEELARLWEAMHTIAICAYNDTHPTIPDQGYSNLCYGQQASPNGGTITTYIDNGGRTVWYCPSEQRN